MFYNQQHASTLVLSEEQKEPIEFIVSSKNYEQPQ